QFVGMDDMKFAMRETDLLVQYLEEHQEVTDLLFTGGDPMIMSYKVFSQYITPFLAEDNKTNIQTIRIGTKALGFWPYKLLTDNEAENFSNLFQKIVDTGINLSIMAHFNKPKELQTKAVQEAVKKILANRSQTRTQSPHLKGPHDSADVWAK